MSIYEEIDNALESLVGQKFTRQNMLDIQVLILELRAEVRKETEEETKEEIFNKIADLDCRDKFPIRSEEWEKGYNEALSDVENV